MAAHRIIVVCLLVNLACLTFVLFHAQPCEKRRQIFPRDNALAQVRVEYVEDDRGGYTVLYDRDGKAFQFDQLWTYEKEIQ